MASALQRRMSPSRRGVQETPYPSGPYKGMRDSLDPSASQRDRARLLQNCYPLDPVNGSAVVGRPGFQVAGAIGGASSKRTGQRVCQFTKRDGTQYTVRVVGGQGIQTFNWATRLWTTVVSVANLTTASITLSETAKVYVLGFADKLTFSDGVNKPFQWDGTSGSGGLTLLSNAPVFYGPPVNYYAKIMGVKATDRSTFVWSEENQPNVGYEAGGYNNAWSLTQTDPNGFTSLAAEDDALYLFRANSITKVTGAVTPTFASTGVREAVSATVGTLSPASVLVDDSGIWFLDQLARPQVIVGGEIPEPPIWQDVRETAVGVDLTQLPICESWYDPTTRLVCLGYPEVGQSICTAAVCYAPQTKVPVAVFRGYPFQAVGVVLDSVSMTRVVMHLSSDGYAYDHGTENGDLWDDELVAGTQAIAHVTECMPVGYDVDEDKNWVRIDLSLRAMSNMTLGIDYLTPYGSNVSQTLTFSVSGAFSQWDVDEWDDCEWVGASLEVHQAAGWNGFGRWLVWRLTHATIGERFGFLMGSANARPISSAPGVP